MSEKITERITEEEIKEEQWRCYLGSLEKDEKEFAEWWDEIHREHAANLGAEYERYAPRKPARKHFAGTPEEYAKMASEWDQEVQSVCGNMPKMQ